ncbi:MAG: hypothetical protein ACREIF_12495 [Chthoniobacterales bacterium]
MKSIPADGKAFEKKRTRSSSIASDRWAAYAAAGVASMVAVSPSAEAEVHYSGIVNYDFAAHGGQGSFPLDPGVNLAMRVGIPQGTSSQPFGHVFVGGASANGAFVGQLEAYTSPLASSLPAGVALSRQSFPVSCTFNSSTGGQVCYYSGANIGQGNFQTQGTTFIGFEFTNESGLHYGWARVKLSGAPRYRFELVDYAWADPGEGLRTGQRRSHTQAEATTKCGSLGLLAVGGAGLKAWRTQK